MLRSRLKNIINKSKEISNKQKSVGDSFEEFKKSLPKEIEIRDDYRLEAAWKAYGSPKDYKQALWEGMILPIDENNVKLPSIGYNEEADEYEYLNKGEDNETVAKDIRVWDNDVIPLVKELKLGGYVRTFNKEKDCWTYTKNSQKRIESSKDNELQINSFLYGGKPIYNKWKELIDFDINDDYDLESAYNDPEISYEKLEEWRKSKGLSHLPSKYKKSNHMTYSDPGYGWSGSDKEGWTFRPSPRLLQEHSFEDYIKYWDKAEPNSKLDYAGRIYYKTPIMFKEGGQMSVIPEGALHARKNNMEGAGEDFTHKGIPVIDNKGEQQAEIERNEIIFRKEVTDKMEELYKKFNNAESDSEKNKIAIEMGKILACEIIKHTDDKTGLIQEILEKM